MDAQQKFGNVKFDHGDNLETILDNIEKSLPQVLSRAEASRLSGGLISAKTLSNEDCLGNGPQERVRVGQKVGYTKASFMGYLRKKICMG